MGESTAFFTKRGRGYEIGSKFPEDVYKNSKYQKIFKILGTLKVSWVFFRLNTLPCKIGGGILQNLDFWGPILDF